MAVTSELAVITPSYALDFELCTELNASVLSHTPDSVAHYIITPRRDLKIFASSKDPVPKCGQLTSFSRVVWWRSRIRTTGSTFGILHPL